MKRNPRQRRPATIRDARLASEVPAVPTFQPDLEKKQDQPAQVAPEHGATEDAVVRQMVEAAYT